MSCLISADKPTKVTIDKEKRIMVVNGKPFFPIGIMGGFIENLPEIADAGFNLTMRWRGATTHERVDRNQPVDSEQNKKAVLTYLDAVHKAGLYALETPVKLSDVYMKFRDKEWEKKYPGINNEVTPIVVEHAKKHPAVIGYYNYDEPDNFYPDDPVDSPRRLLQQEGVEKWYKKVKELDPHHPVLTLFAVGLKKVKDWNAWDLGCTDHYPMEDHHLSNVYKHAHESDHYAKEKGTPYIFTPLFEKSSGRLRPMNAAEQRAQTYLALIGGAKGILWWEWPASYKQNWEEIKKLIPEIKLMSPFLLENSPAQEMVYSQEGTDKTVKVLVKQLGNKLLIICANSDPHPVKVVIKSDVLRQAYFAGVAFEKRKVKITRGEISDTFAGYGTHVYVAKLPSARPVSLNEKPLKIELDIEIDKTPLPKAKIYSKGERNIAFNGSFEHSYVHAPGWPAHWGQAVSMMTSGDVGDSKGLWTLDTKQKYHGNASLRMTKTSEGIANSTGVFTFCEAPGMEQAVNHPEKGKYTFSVYLKAKKPARAWLMAAWGTPKKVEVTTKWQRYSLTYDKNSPGKQTVRVYLLEKGILWADGVQVEAGESMTEYEHVEPK